MQYSSHHEFNIKYDQPERQRPHKPAEEVQSTLHLDSVVRSDGDGWDWSSSPLPIQPGVGHGFAPESTGASARQRRSERCRYANSSPLELCCLESAMMSSQEYEEAYREARYALYLRGKRVGMPAPGREGLRVCNVNSAPLSDLELFTEAWGRAMAEDILSSVETSADPFA